MTYRAVFAMLSVVLLSACGINSIPTAEEEVNAKWANYQTSLQRRSDTIPNFVATAKAAAGGSEDKILTDVMNARAKATQVTLAPADLSDPQKVAAFQQAQQQFGGTIGRLISTVEAYPNLKSQENFPLLLNEIERSNNRVAQDLRDYNTSVQSYNTRIRTFPDAIGAKVFYGAKPKIPFQAEAGAATDFKVDFGNMN